MKVRDHDVNKIHKKYDGQVMFPTTHDITPRVLDECSTVLKNLLESGNKVLIVTKPHLDCMMTIVTRFKRGEAVGIPVTNLVLFRFTIGAISDEILGYWEPYAPKFEERLQSLKAVYSAGFRTSVSAEPLLEHENVVELVSSLMPYITDSLWIGKLNNIDSRVSVTTEEDQILVSKIKAGQTDEKIKEIYQNLKSNLKPEYFSKLKWKESYKKVLGMELVKEEGLDV